MFWLFKAKFCFSVLKLTNLNKSLLRKQFGFLELAGWTCWHGRWQEKCQVSAQTEHIFLLTILAAILDSFVPSWPRCKHKKVLGSGWNYLGMLTWTLAGKVPRFSSNGACFYVDHFGRHLFLRWPRCMHKKVLGSGWSPEKQSCNNCNPWSEAHSIMGPESNKTKSSLTVIARFSLSRQSVIKGQKQENRTNHETDKSGIEIFSFSRNDELVIS